MVNKMKRDKPTIGISLGDVAGIGPEIVAKIAANGTLEEHAHPIIVGDESALLRGMEIANVTFDYTVVDSIEKAVKIDSLVLLHTNSIDANKVTLGVEDSTSGKDAAMNIESLVTYSKDGYLDGLSFAPNNKKAIKSAGYQLDGSIDLINGFFGGERYASEINVVDNVWTVRVTGHIPVKDISDHLTVEKINKAINLINSTLKLTGLENPHIAIAALNPHAGEGGTCGREEIDVISPAVEKAQESGVRADGPYPADTLFKKVFDGEFDGVVTMFHDQGQIALKLKGYDNGTTIMGGLPAPVTTCTHGSAFDIAGKGIANPGALESAFKLASKLAAIKKSEGQEVR